MDNTDVQSVIDQVINTEETLLVSNAFSINMLNAETSSINDSCYCYRFDSVTIEQAQQVLKSIGGRYRCCIGHVDTAQLVGNQLGLELAANRETVSLAPHGVMLVAQYTGPRLPEGTSTLPEGASISYWLVW